MNTHLLCTPWRICLREEVEYDILSSEFPIAHFPSILVREGECRRGIALLDLQKGDSEAERRVSKWGAGTEAQAQS